MATRFVNVWARRLDHRVLTWILVAMSSTVSEAFFLVVVPVTCWCVSLTFGRHMLLLSAASLFLANVLKNLLELPRPVDIEVSAAWHTERAYGLPSTHALTAVLLPCYAFLCFPALRTPEWYAAATLWAAGIAFSRIYLGVHSVPDVVAGVLLGLLLAFGYHFGVEAFADRSVVAVGDALWGLVPLVLLAGGALCIWLHPDPNPESPTLDESAVCMGAAVATLLCEWWRSWPGSWKLAHIPPDSTGSGLARFALGMIVLLAVKIVSKKAFMLLLRPIYSRLPARHAKPLQAELLAEESSCTGPWSPAVDRWKRAGKKVRVMVALSHPHWHDMHSTVAEQKWLEVSVKYLSYMLAGIVVLDIAPLLFRVIGI